MPTSLHEKKTGCRQWTLILIFCVDVHLGLNPPVHMRPPEPDPLPLRVDVINDFPVTPISPTTSRNIYIGFQSLLALNIKFCLLFLRPKWGWHLNISVTPSGHIPSSSTLHG